MLEKLEGVKARFDELERQIADPGLIARQEEWLKCVKERAALEPVVSAYVRYAACLKSGTKPKSSWPTPK